MQELKNSADLVQYLRNNPTSDAMRAAADRIEELEAQLKRGGDQNGNRAGFEAWAVTHAALAQEQGGKE